MIELLPWNLAALDLESPTALFEVCVDVCELELWGLND